VFAIHQPGRLTSLVPAAARLPQLGRHASWVDPGLLTSLPQSVISSSFLPFLFRRLHTLQFSEVCKSFVCHSYENNQGVYQLFPLRNSFAAIPSSVFAVFAQRAFHNSFAIKWIHTLSKNSRVA
jgi:hypothetical protein